MTVPSLDLKAQYEKLAPELLAAVQHVFESQSFILGNEVARLEEEVAAYCGTAHGIGCASGSDALLLALMAAGVDRGDEVITTPFTFFATGGAVSRLGARPVFVDIDAGTFNIDPAKLETAISPRTKAIMPVHLFGQCADMQKVTAVAASRNLSVIEDAAQAIGADYKGTSAGGLGRVGAFSFYPTKNLGGAGDGGMLTTNDADLAERLRTLRVHGAKKKYFHDYVGINSRLDALQAAVLRVKFKYLEDWAEARRLRAERYRLLFGNSGLTDRGELTLPVDAGYGRHVYNQFVIRAERRDELRAFLKHQGIGTEVYYPLPLHLQHCFADLEYQPGDLPESERASKEVLALPIYPELSETAQDYVVERVIEFYGR
jgi:dTDP-4-amino-4,6-dideoxygalactose transaminase